MTDPDLEPRKAEHSILGKMWSLTQRGFNIRFFPVEDFTNPHTPQRIMCIRMVLNRDIPYHTDQYIFFEDYLTMVEPEILDRQLEIMAQRLEKFAADHEAESDHREEQEAERVAKDMAAEIAKKWGVHQ